MANTDIRLKLSLFGHRKWKRLGRSGGAVAQLGLLRLWAWTAEYYPKGRLVGAERVEIEEVVGGYENLEHLIVLGWLDVVPALPGEVVENSWNGVPVLHDWEQHQEWACYAPEREMRARHAAKVKASKRDAAAERAAKGQKSGARGRSKRRSAGRTTGRSAGRTTPSPSPPPTPTPVEGGEGAGRAARPPMPAEAGGRAGAARWEDRIDPGGDWTPHEADEVLASLRASMRLTGDVDAYRRPLAALADRGASPRAVLSVAAALTGRAAPKTPSAFLRALLPAVPPDVERPDPGAFDDTEPVQARPGPRGSLPLDPPPEDVDPWDARHDDDPLVLS